MIMVIYKSARWTMLNVRLKYAERLVSWMMAFVFFVVVFSVPTQAHECSCGKQAADNVRTWELQKKACAELCPHWTLSLSLSSSCLFELISSFLLNSRVLINMHNWIAKH